MFANEEKLPSPDLTILLDINPNLSIKRISKRIHNNSYDKTIKTLNS